MFEKVKKYIKNHIDPKLTKPLLLGKPHVLLGLSGGPDSVFLLHVLKRFEQEGLISLSAAHLNHGWREQADEEELFCKQLCEEQSVSIFVDRIKNIKINFKSNGSKEEMGRLFRRHFFENIKDSHNIDYVALAHHQQDQQETFFIRLIRGCSLAGLTAIKSVQGFYVRPLLSTTKSDILCYLDKNNINYVIDCSNESDNYLRNRIRKYVMPALSQVDLRFNQKFQTTLDTLEQENKLLQKITKQVLKETFSDNRGCGKAFESLDPIMQKRVLIEWLCEQNVKFCPSTSFLEEIIRFIVSDRGGAHELHKNWRIKKQKKQFWIERT